MVADIRSLGPLGIPGRFQDWDRELAELQHAVEKAEAGQPSCRQEVAHA
jgi:hypothetical protein